jgi:hypothetical protein
MTDEQINIIITKLEKLDGIIEEIEALYFMINTQLNNLSHGIKLIMYASALIIFVFAVKFLWTIFNNWFFGGV